MKQGQRILTVLPLTLFRHPCKRPGFQKCGNTAFCHRPWVRRRFISRNPQPLVLAAGQVVRGRQGSGWCRLHGCSGHHAPCPGPEGLFFFLTSCNSHLGASAFIHSLEKFDPLPLVSYTLSFWSATTLLPEARLKTSHCSRALSNVVSNVSPRQLSLLCWLVMLKQKILT